MTSTSFTPNTAQLAAIRDGYSAPVVSWEIKRGEYDNEGKPGHGFAGIATLENGWIVTVGRYGAVLNERRAVPMTNSPHTEDLDHMDTSEEPCTDHGFDVCPDCGDVGVKIGENGYEPCTRFLTCWADA